jgi:uncharacterized protein YprB with RNaseH-like and TPR domain
LTWTPLQDSALRALDDGNRSASQIAAEMGLTKDSVQKRLRKLRARQHEITPPQEEAGLSVPAAGDDFVGIRTIWWDLESTGLTAIMGRILCASFADSWGNVKTFRYEDYPGETLIDDGPLVLAIRDELEKAGHWVTWNGKLFDVPLLNARLLKAGHRPLRKDIMHTDLMYFARGQFVRIGSSKLVNVSTFIDSPNQKTPLEWETWQLAATGDKAAMDQIVVHCEADVMVTRDVFAVLGAHITTIHR